MPPRSMPQYPFEQIIDLRPPEEIQLLQPQPAPPPVPVPAPTPAPAPDGELYTAPTPGPTVGNGVGERLTQHQQLVMVQIAVCPAHNGERSNMMANHQGISDDLVNLTDRSSYTSTSVARLLKTLVEQYNAIFEEHGTSTLTQEGDFELAMRDLREIVRKEGLKRRRRETAVAQRAVPVTERDRQNMANRPRDRALASPVSLDVDDGVEDVISEDEELPEHLPDQRSRSPSRGRGLARGRGNRSGNGGGNDAGIRQAPEPFLAVIRQLMASHQQMMASQQQMMASQQQMLKAQQRQHSANIELRREEMALHREEMAFRLEEGRLRRDQMRLLAQQLDKRNESRRRRRGAGIGESKSRSSSIG